jgi:hypothetical protein
MVKVYDMVTYTLCASDDDAQVLPAAYNRHAELPQTELGLQIIAATPARLEAELHPALRYTDVEDFLAALDR